MARAIGLDLGRRRIGVAVSDSDGRLALARGVVKRVGDQPVEHAEIAAIVDEVGATTVVVGLPLAIDGTVDVAAKAIQSETKNLAKRLAVPVELIDERLTTVEAERGLRAAGLDAAARRSVIDAEAAAVILQAWLDRTERQPG